MPMTAPLRKSLTMLLAQVPTVLTLAVLGGVFWWGYIWDWKIPRLPELLGRSETKTDDDKKPEENKEGDSANKPLPLVTLPSEEALNRAGIKLAAVKRRTVNEYAESHGEVDFDQNHYAHLSTRASGTAWSVHKQPGDQVKKGDVLALVACPELASIKFNLQQTLLLVETRRRLYDRLQSAASANAGQAIDTADASLREANIRLSNEVQSLQNLGLSIRVEELRKLSDSQVADRLRTLGIPDTLLQGRDTGTLTSNLLPMYAPFDGVVVKRDIVIGEVVTPSTPQFVLADLRRLWIMLHVRLEDAHKVAEKQDVIFRPDGAGRDTPPAKITFISPEVDEKTRTVIARAEVPNPKGDLRPRTFGTARIVVGKRDRLTVPNEALQFDGTSHVVFVRGKSDTEFQPVRVKLGPRHDHFIEITPIEAGIEAGQWVAAAGSHVLLSEMRKERIEGGD
jgi:cobalt-zinc-cadmium efflux system membrane fusion protein